jgi:class 3 adenylate cyclase
MKNEPIPASGEVFSELVRASALLTRENDADELISVLVEQAIDITRSDLACLYAYGDDPGAPLKLLYQRGRFTVPKKLNRQSELVSFVEDVRESLVLLRRGEPYFDELFLTPEMNSGICLPLYTNTAEIGLLILNGRAASYYGRDRFFFLDSFVKLAAGMLENTELVEEIKARLRQIEALERYQESIFSSMTNLLVTTDNDGKIAYFNDAAAKRLGLGDGELGVPLKEYMKGKLSPAVMRAIGSSLSDGSEALGIEGIFRGEPSIDFSLNLSPLSGKRGKKEGMTLLFTDQTAERELKKQVKSVREERRVIKDMFSRYLSQEVVDNLVEKPELIKLGGDKKIATVFFADIRGYTTFSETQEPEKIIEILNAYFSEAVEVIIRHRGYIDKFIGDAIMAAWGVPMQSEQEDAVSAVSCALEIQELIARRDRTFFKGPAKNLKVGIGMHTGPLVAGNLGSDRRMDYSVIGDTVNVAARLEGVAEAGQVVITKDTRDLIGDRFKVKERKPVKVKGKEQPIPVFNVLKLIS